MSRKAVLGNEKLKIIGSLAQGLALLVDKTELEYNDVVIQAACVQLKKQLESLIQFDFSVTDKRGAQILDRE